MTVTLEEIAVVTATVAVVAALVVALVMMLLAVQQCSRRHQQHRRHNRRRRRRCRRPRRARGRAFMYVWPACIQIHMYTHQSSKGTLDTPTLQQSLTRAPQFAVVTFATLLHCVHAQLYFFLKVKRVAGAMYKHFFQHTPQNSCEKGKICEKAHASCYACSAAALEVVVSKA